MSQSLDKKGVVGVVLSEVSPDPHQSRNSPYGTKKPVANPRICGVRKGIFIAVASVVLLGLGLGIGLGVGMQPKVPNTAASTVSTTSANPAMLYTSSTTSAQRSATASVTTTLITSTLSSSQTSSAPLASGTASTSCPSTNGTTYTASGHTFLILCGMDIQTPNKVDMGRVYQPTFNACIDSCALLSSGKRSDISAVYWVDYSDTRDIGTCWCFGGTSRSDDAHTSTWAANDLAWIQS